MDFDKAIASHSKWKSKLAKYIHKPDGSIKISDIEPDHKCELGKWIHLESVKKTCPPEFQELKEVHQLFHNCAAMIIKQSDRGENLSADLQLGSSSNYAELSAKIIKLIMQMNQNKYHI